MIRNTEPRLRFSVWYPWKQTKQLQEKHLPGIYALARFDKPPSGAVDPLSADVIYIGETCSQTFGKRLYQFNRSAFRGKPAHSGGRTYHATLKDGDERLYFAVLTAGDVPEQHVPWFIRYMERMLLWKFVKKWGQPPVCNLK